MRWALRLGPLAAILIPLLAVALLVGFVVVMTDEPPPPVCGPAGLVAQVAGQPGTPAGAVAGYSGEQLANAATIMRAGADLGLPVLGQTIGVMTAMGESSLRVLDVGDAAGPDSRGLFQQRANGAWGSYEQRMDPYSSALSFFRVLAALPGWEALAPTIAAHRVQRNADPWHYERYWSAATQVVAALGGGIAPVPGADGGVPCQETPVVAGGDLPAGTWTKPAVGTFTSGYGPRGGVPHNGVDLAAPLGTTVVAAADGVVVGVCLSNSSPCTGYGTLVTVDHGGGVLTRYAHARPEDVLVTVGQQVRAGQQLTRMGTFGDSTGPHLHFEVQVTGSGSARFTDPEPFLRARGVDLRGPGLT